MKKNFVNYAYSLILFYTAKDGRIRQQNIKVISRNVQKLEKMFSSFDNFSGSIFVSLES